VAGAVFFFLKTLTSRERPARKWRIPDSENILSHFVTSLTILGHVKCRRTIMTSAAGFTLFHLLHIRRVSTALRCEEFRMTLVTAEHAEVSLMGEGDVAGIFIDVEDITGMAGHAVSRDAEGLLAVVAKTAGLTGLHILHGEGRILPGDDVIDIVMTGGTVLAD